MSFVRAATQSVVTPLLARPVLRLLLGRWPSQGELRLFSEGMRQKGRLPPILRGMTRVPAAVPLLARSALVSRANADADYRARLPAAADPLAGWIPGDPTQVWTGPPIGFMHLEKTAGTSVLAFLQTLFHPLQIAPNPLPDAWRTECPASRSGRLAPYRLIWGHYDLTELRQMAPEHRLITFLREPRARVISYYYFWRSFNLTEREACEPAAGMKLGGQVILPGMLKAQSSGLLEFLRDQDPEVRNHFDNLYVRRLTGRYIAHGDDPLTADPAASLAAALAALRQLWFVGVTEAIDVSLARLCGLLDVVPPPNVPRANVSVHNEIASSAAFRPIAREPITDAIEAELDRLTRLDAAVYAAARTALMLG